MTARQGPEPEPAARPAWAVPAGLAAWAVVYPVAFRFRLLPLWPAMVALAVVAWWVAWHPDLEALLRPTRRLVAIGLASGLVLYAVFAVGALAVHATPLWPRVEQVAVLVRTAAPGPVAALLILFVTSPAEEVLWRGAVFGRLARRLGPGWRPVAGTTLLYALFVALAGNLTLPLAACACGAVWARQRQVTGSLVPSVVSHATWALATFLLLPGLPRS
ncbi:MAG TPA: type II CAAX endopeptidase family protein [Actinomycetes bacterium]